MEHSWKAIAWEPCAAACCESLSMTDRLYSLSPFLFSNCAVEIFIAFILCQSPNVLDIVFRVPVSQQVVRVDSGPGGLAWNRHCERLAAGADAVQLHVERLA